MVNVIPNTGKVFIGATIQTALAVSTIKLFKNDMVPDVGTVLADFTEADFSGYAAQAVATWGVPYIDQVNGGVSITAPAHQFQAANPTTVPNTVYGYYLEDTGGNLVQAGRFDAPIDMVQPSDGFVLAVTINQQ